ncbi:cytoskeleton-associated protein 2 [Discoglossus pictus]
MSIAEQKLPASRRQQPQYREQRRKKLEEYIERKMSVTGPNEQLENRSPLTEKGNLVRLSNKTEISKPIVQNQVNKENIDLNAKKSLFIKITVKNVAANTSVKVVKGKESQATTLSQSFLKTKIFKEKQGEKLIQECNIDVVPKTSKPVLGAYRGKIVQSKINSFRKASNSSDTKSPTEEKKQPVNHPKATTRSQTSHVATRPIFKSVPVVKPKVPPTTQARPQVRMFPNSLKDRPELGTAKKYTNTYVRKETVASKVWQKPNPEKNMKPKLQVSVPNKKETIVAPDKNRKPAGIVGPQNAIANRRKTMAAPVNVKPATQQNRPSTQPAVGGKYQRHRETAEERKARLAEWRASKGKVMKRPPQKVSMSLTFKVPKEEPEEYNLPDQLKTPAPKLFWATMAEEDEQELFTVKVHKIFAECQKLIDEGLPKDDVLGILETHVQSVPEAKKLSKYWECLARLEQRQGRLDKVIAICEEAVAAGAQPLDELRNILADALENMKVADLKSEETFDNQHLLQEHIKAESDIKSEVKAEPLKEEFEKHVRVGRGKKSEAKEKKLAWKIDEKQSEPVTPENECATSVIKFNVRSTPYLQSIKKKIQGEDAEPPIKELKFLTPVRRSMRIDRKSQRLPDMLKDHDPCLSTLAQLGELGNDSQAYIYRHNDAISEMNPSNLPKH